MELCKGVERAVSPSYIVILLVLLFWSILSIGAEPALASSPPPVCFWSDQGLACVERTVEIGATGLPEPEALLTALLAGPTAQEQAQGIRSAIPEGTTLAGLEIQPDHTVVVRLEVPFQALHDLDHATFDVIVEQIGWTLEPLGWRSLYIQTWDPIAGEFVPLAAFLPEIPPPRKTSPPPPPPVGANGRSPLPGPHLPQAGQVGGEGLSPAYVGQPPAPGQAQPQGALTGKTIYVSAGHGWEWDYDGRCDCYRWKTQRPVYQGFIEDHNNAEAVDQYLLQYLWNAGATVIPVRERDMNPVDKIPDNDGSEPGTGYAEQGVWATDTLTGYLGLTYRYTTTVAVSPTAVAVWTATLPSDGEYAVYAWYRQGPDRAPDARYTVYHAGGRTEVVVDQRVHGNTWHYLGTYGFRSGEVATVTLSNLSAYSGTVVVADAVRFGGGTFDDLTGIRTSASYPPDKPWWEVAAYYYVQRMGMDPEALNLDPNDPGDNWGNFNDVVARPIYARWEHAGTEEDALYISWHTNGYNGTARGTTTYVHNGEWLPRTSGSYTLATTVHGELVHDIREGWDASWADLDVKEKNLGELRLLWDDDPSVRMPGALVEIAFHDNPDDAAALKEPTFQMLAARAIYQGIVKYFAQRDNVSLPLLPEPPTHLAVRNVGGGRVRISWRPSPTDTVGLVGDAADYYRVYTSTDGIGWSNGISVGNTTAYTLTGLSPGQLLFVRVTAVNRGGESFPTETLAVRVGNGAGVLLVNGFDRLNQTMLVPDYDPVEGFNLRMLLDRMNSYNYTIQHGEVISAPFDSASNEAVRDGDVDLSDYAVVDWILGEESAPDQTLDPTERSLLADFLDNGGALFISGTEIGWHLDEQGGDPAFYNGYLRADYVADDAGTYEVEPVAGSIFDGLPRFRFDAPGMYDADYPDVITPTSGSTAALAYSGGTGGVAAVQYENGCQRLVYFGFPFETTDPNERATVMTRVMEFSECAKITTIQDGDFFLQTRVPPLEGRAWAYPNVGYVEVSLRRDVDGLYWDGQTWGTTQWTKAVGTTSWSFTMPLTMEVGTYTAAVRVWDDGGNVDLTPEQVTFRIVPGVFLPLVMREFTSPFTDCVDLIVNGGFEGDDGWNFSNAAYTTTLARSGARSARVGILPGEPGADNYSSVFQSVTLPAGSRATLSVWVYPIGEGGDTGDYHYIGLRDESSVYHALDHWWSDDRVWELRTYDLSAYAGQTVTLYVGTRNDGDDDTAAMYVDDVSLVVCPP